MVRFRLKGQPNCEVFKLQGDTLKYQACKKSEEIKGHYQFSKKYQQILDDAISIDPTFDFPYRRKSVAYLKSGDFVTWKELIDKAVELNPKEHLGARAWCRFSWFRDHEGTIKDIETLQHMVSYDIGYTTNGVYHLGFVMALSYSALGQHSKAIEIIETLFQNEKYSVGLYDYYHYGVISFNLGKFEQAKQAFIQQKEENNFGENEYYLALVYAEFKDEKNYLEHISKALLRYERGNSLNEDYNHTLDKVYLKDIEKARTRD